MPKFSQQPLCRLDGRPIRKKTESVFFAGSQMRDRRPENPQTKAEAQRYVNQQIVSIRKGYKGISHVTTWDGESYEDAYFCTGDCARRFGYFAMEHPAAETQAYADAMRAAGRR